MINLDTTNKRMNNWRSTLDVVIIRYYAVDFRSSC
jgi:hypothetical protein